MLGMRHAVAAALLIWLLALLYFTSSLYSLQSKKESYSDGVSEKLGEALAALEKMQRQNDLLRDLVELERKEYGESLKLLLKREEKQAIPSLLPKPPPSVESGRNNCSSREDQLYSREHEETRRVLENRIWETFFYAKTHLKRKEITPEATLKHLEDQLISLLGLSARFSSVDDSMRWRSDGLANLTRHIQHHINLTQHPHKCNEAKILVCDLDKQCGFGCQLHHAAYCFIVAFAENRTMVFEKDAKIWRYSKDGWSAAFLPISSCSLQEAIDKSEVQQYKMSSDARVVSLPIVDSLMQHPPFLPLAFPSSIAHQLLTFHSNPPVFFIAQFLWYLMRTSPEMTMHLSERVARVPFEKGPVVGLQVRRTDKIGTEASFHAVSEYIHWAEIWFRVEEATRGIKLKRRVFIATDESSVVGEARKRYPEYEIYGDENVAREAALSSRYSNSALHGIVADIHLLSHCDYLVCTFSSQVCRMGYELMQVRRNATGEQFHSLDDIYYFGGQQAHEQVAIEAYEPEGKDEIGLKPGDILGIAGNHWNGFSKGSNRNTEKMGLYPSYKVKEKWRTVDFPVLPPMQ